MLGEQHGTLSLPLMARPNAVLPVGANENRLDYDHADGVTHHVFALEDGAVATAQPDALGTRIVPDKVSILAIRCIIPSRFYPCQEGSAAVHVSWATFK
jgi:hypothetical protein